MHRIDNSTAAASLPAPAAAGSPGYWTAGNPLSGTPATIMDQDWFNSFQEELIGIVLAAGLTPDKANRAQVLAAMRAMYAPRMQVIAATGTFVVPAGVTRLKVRCWGGGGGGGAAGAGGVATGGSGAGYGEGTYEVTPGASVAVTVGGGGTGGIVDGATPTAGGTSSFGAFLSCTGGGAGVGATGAVQSSVGAGGTVTGAAFARVGATAEPGGISGGIYLASPGGFAFGSGYGHSSFTAGSVGNDGGLGGGGCGGTNSNNGGAGGPGLVIVEW